MDTYIFTDHAIEQYLMRLRKMGMDTMPREPRKAMLKLLSTAKEEHMKQSHKVKRIMKHGFRPASYFVNGGWRFVVSEDNVVITVERVKPRQN
jgi:hypothetical protein